VKGQSITVKWSGIATPATWDWVGIYTPGSNDYAYLDWAYTNGGGSGTVNVSLSHPSLAAGSTYEARLYANDGYTLLAKSPPFTVVAGSSTPAALYYYHHDHRGAPQAMTNEAGAVVWRATYDPFGQAAVTVSTITNNLRLDGYWDSETSLLYNGARYRDLDGNRFLSSDPIGLTGGLNTYVAVGNNPLRWTDPSGQAIPIAIAACLADPPCLAALGAGIAAAGAAIQNTINSTGPVVIDPSQPIPPQLPGYVPESQRRAETRVPADLLPPGPSNICDKQLAEDRKQCELSCSNVATKAACMTKAFVKFWICKGGQKPNWPDSGGHDGGDGGGPVWTPGGGF
jgi:RHS repeat-associated protein